MIIGIVGPSDSAQKIAKTLKKMDVHIIKTYIREKVEDAPEVIEQCESECDGIIFTGIGVHESVKANYKLTKPNTFVPRSGTSILRAFWEIQNEGLLLKKFSIDVVEDEVLYDILDEINIVPNVIYSKPFLLSTEENQYLRWHIELFENKKTDLMITGFGDVYNELKRLGYPVFRLYPTNSLIKGCYDTLLSKTQMSIVKSSQIAIELLNLNDFEEKCKNYYSSMIKKTDIEKLILEYIKGIQGSMFNMGRAEYIVFCNRGMADTPFNFNLIQKLISDVKNLGFCLKVGIGFGSTVYAAEINGRTALNRSIKLKDTGVFIADSEGMMRGPIGHESELEYNVLVKDEKLNEISSKTGISAEYLSKLSALGNKKNSKIFDADELADFLGISERSARRIIKKIVDSGYAHMHAKKSSSGVGRPKHLVQFHF